VTLQRSVVSTAAGSWTATASMAAARAHLTATRLGNGRVLVVGGVDESTTELYDPLTGTWVAGGTLNQPRWLHAAVRLADGRVLVADSANGDVYSPATGTWTATGPMVYPGLSGRAAAVLANGQVLYAGGERFYCGVKNCFYEPSANAELYTP
jgi:N-acetylneuraminic acid mutarotase